MGQIVRAKWVAHNQKVYVEWADGTVREITSVDPEWQEIVVGRDEGNAGIIPIVSIEPPPTAEDVRREAARRMRAMVGARDDHHLNIIISNGIREATHLLAKLAEGGVLTNAEQARKAALEQVDAAIDAIRAASNTLEAANPIPVDFTDDVYWT